MQKIVRCILVMGLCISLCGCRDAELSKRKIVHAVFVGKTQEEYQLRFLCGAEEKALENVNGSSLREALNTFCTDAGNSAYFGVLNHIFFSEALTRNDLEDFARLLQLRAGFLSEVQLAALQTLPSQTGQAQELCGNDLFGGSEFFDLEGERDIVLPLTDAEKTTTICYSFAGTTTLTGPEAAVLLVMGTGCKEVSFENSDGGQIFWRHASAACRVIPGRDPVKLEVVLYGSLETELDSSALPESAERLTAACAQLAGEQLYEQYSILPFHSVLMRFDPALAEKFYVQKQDCRLACKSQLILLESAKN